MVQFTRRHILTASGAMLVGACSSGSTQKQSLSPALQQSNYGPIVDEPFPIPAVNFSTVKPGFGRRVVRYSSQEPVGTIIVDTDTYHLYLTMARGQALRYDVGLGRQVFRGVAMRSSKASRNGPNGFRPRK